MTPEIYEIEEIGNEDAIFEDEDKNELIGVRIKLMEEGYWWDKNWYCGRVEIVSELPKAWKKSVAIYQILSENEKQFIPFYQVKLKPIE